MTKLEQAAKQALEALERLEGLHLSRGITCSGIIANLREALAEPEHEPVAWDVFSKHGRIYFAIGNQSFPVDYTPEDEPDCSAGQAADWYMEQMRHALKKLSNTHPQPAAHWVGLSEDDMNLLVEQARKVPEYSPCPDYNTRLLMLADFKLREKNGGKA